MRELLTAHLNSNTDVLSQMRRCLAVIFMDKDGMLNVTGGKWTTYRSMAEQVRVQENNQALDRII